MANIKAGVVLHARVCAIGLVLALVMAGCASGAVQRGALIGAISGAALGSGTGVLISNQELLGSSAALETGDIALEPGPTIAATSAIGVVFGAIVGAMIGHASDDELVLPANSAPSQAHAAGPSAF